MTALSLAFLERLGLYLVSKAANPLFDYALELANDELEKLCSDPPPMAWEGEALTAEQKSFIRTLPKIQAERQRPIFAYLAASLRQSPRRGILIIGPSGAGKSQVERSLRGLHPLVDEVYTKRTTKRKTNIQGLKVPISDSPGDRVHALEGYGKMVDLLTGSHPPLVIIMIVAGGYLASSMSELRSTYIRPSSQGRPIANTTADFVSYCKKEEADYLHELIDTAKARTKKRANVATNRFQSVITVINKRDLWSLDQSTIEYYSDPSSPYSDAINEFRTTFGKPDQHSHDIIPMFTHGGGFHPDSSVMSRAYTPFDAAIDSLLLRALVNHRYSGGGALTK